MGYLSPERWASSGNGQMQSTCGNTQTPRPAPAERGSTINRVGIEDVMEEVGLMPSDTGRPGGRKTGQHMSGYPIQGGLSRSCPSRYLGSIDGQNQ